MGLKWLVCPVAIVGLIKSGALGKDEGWVGLVKRMWIPCEVAGKNYSELVELKSSSK